MWYFKAQNNTRKSDMVHDSKGDRDKQQDFGLIAACVIF